MHPNSVWGQIYPKGKAEAKHFHSSLFIFVLAYLRERWATSGAEALAEEFNTQPEFIWQIIEGRVEISTDILLEILPFAAGEAVIVPKGFLKDLRDVVETGKTLLHDSIQDHPTTTAINTMPKFNAVLETLDTLR